MVEIWQRIHYISERSEQPTGVLLKMSAPLFLHTFQQQYPQVLSSFVMALFSAEKGAITHKVIQTQHQSITILPKRNATLS